MTGASASLPKAQQSKPGAIVPVAWHGDSSPAAPAASCGGASGGGAAAAAAIPWQGIAFDGAGFSAAGASAVSITGAQELGAQTAQAIALMGAEARSKAARVAKRRRFTSLSLSFVR